MIITVQERLVGGIIGRGGHKIALIRQRSGSNIKIAALEPGANERKITLTGTAQQNNLANQLIQARLQEAEKEAPAA